MIKKLRKYAANRFPESVKVSLYRAWQYSNDIRLTARPVRHRVAFTNIFACTVHKAGSQWLKSVFFDPEVYEFSGIKPLDMRTYTIDERSYPKRKFSKPFPKNRVVAPWFIGYEGFHETPKLGDYRAVFVMRDPRDIAVSYYFSMKDSHTPMGDILEKRAVLKSLNTEEGLSWTINYLQDYGLFDALKSWKKAEEADSRVMAIAYENLTGDGQLASFQKIFSHCDIAIPEATLSKVLAKYSFLEMRKKDWRNDQVSHYRKGIAGDWRNHFQHSHETLFREIAGDLIETLGYSW